MDQEKKSEAQEVENKERELNTDSSKKEERTSSHHHHSSSGHSHHSSSSSKHHSSSRRHSSSSNKKHSRNDNEKKSLIDRIQKWIDKHIGKKTLLVMNVTAIILTVALIAVIFFIETKPQPSVPSDYDPGVETTEETEEENTKVESYDKQDYTVPEYWQRMLDEKIKTVKALQTAGGKDSVSLVWASDTHIPDDSSTRTDDLGKLMAKMLDECDIPFAVLTGDIGTRVSLESETLLLEAIEQIPKHLAPLWGTDRLLVALGNHDGCYGDSSGYYSKQFTPEKLWQTYFRAQALDSRRVFSEDGTYFYVDNEAQKTRFIILNSQYGGEYKTDGNGWAVNNRFTTSCYGQQQLDWLSDVALDMPDGYGAIITSHVPPNVEYTVDKALLCGIIDAYNNKTSYSGSYTLGVDGWSNSSVTVDFSSAKGEIICMLTGHVHGDSIDTTTLSCPLITILSAGAESNEWYDKALVPPSRTLFTDTETNFDVVTVNRETRTIYLTRVGAGYDRMIGY